MIRILVVDDDALILHALTRILENEGHQVIGHTDPFKAAEEREFSIVITDFMMPNLNGIELLGALKQTNPTAVRLLLTAAADFKVALEAVNRGEVYRLLSKPWNLSELTTVVKQAVEHFRLMAENRRLAAELHQRNQHLEVAVIERTNGLLDGMVRALDYRDTETQWHSRRVSLYSKRLAEKVGIHGDQLEMIGQGALLHDIGKIGVRDSILLKPGPLTPEEWVEMKLHPEIGMRMLSAIPYLKEATQIVYQHQERWDGNGYPQTLKGTQIVIGARIFSIVDALDAITSDRPYRKGRPLEIAKAEIGRVGGTQLDPELVTAFLEVPDNDWNAIRRQVEQLEEEDRKKWSGKPLVPSV